MKKILLYLAVLIFMVSMLAIFNSTGKKGPTLSSLKKTTKAKPAENIVSKTPPAMSSTASTQAHTSAKAHTNSSSSSSSQATCVSQNKKRPGKLVAKTTRIDDNKVHFGLRFPKAQITDVELNGETYQKISIPESKSGSFNFGKGTPELPTRKFLVRIPNGNTFDLEVSNLKTERIKNLKLAPRQYRYMDQAEEDLPFKTDDEFYQSSAWYPETGRNAPESVVYAARTVNVRNTRYAEITLALASYQPSSGEAIVVNAVEMSVTSVDPQEAAATEEDPESTLASTGDEDPAPSETSFPSSPTFDSMMGGGDYDMVTMDAGNMPTMSTSTNALERFLIIYNNIYAGNPLLEEFVEWKKRKGYDVVTKSTSETGGARRGDIQSYLNGLSDADWPVYLLFIGNDSSSTGVSMQRTKIAYSMTVSSDFRYSLRTYTEETGLEEWDWSWGGTGNPDDYLDQYPDTMIGRIPAENNTMLNNMLSKMMNIDRSPSRSNTHYQKAIMTGAKDLSLPEQCSDAMLNYFQETYGDDKAELAFDGGNYTGGEWVADSSAKTIWSNGQWQVSDIWLVERCLTQAEAKTKLINEWNEGAAFVTYLCHGGPLGWYWNNHGTPFYREDAAALTNKNMYSVVYDWSCSTADETSGKNITQTLLDDQNGGAYAMISAPQSQLAGYQDMLCWGFLAGGLGDFLPFFRTYPDSHPYPNYVDPAVPVSFIEGAGPRLGQMWWTSKMYGWEYFPPHQYNDDANRLMPDNRAISRNAYLQTLHGDPECFFTFNQPTNLTVSLTNAVPVGSNTIEVSAASGALVALYSPALNIHQAKTATNDIASFEIAPTNAGSVAVTVSKRDSVPYQGGFTVGANRAPAFTNDISNGGIASEGFVYTGSVANVASDPDGDTVTYSISAGPTWLTMMNNGYYYGTPSLSDAGTNTFTIRAADLSGDNSETQMEIVVNSLPTFSANPIVEADATEDVPYSTSILDNTSDPDDDPLAFTKLSGAGWIQVSTNGTLTGTPGGLDIGANSITVRVDDGKAYSDVTVNINVINVNSAPEGDYQSLQWQGVDTGVSVTLTGYDMDDDSLTFSILSQPQHGTLTGTVPNLVYTPDGSFVDMDCFTFEVDDGTTKSAPATIRLWDPNAVTLEMGITTASDSWSTVNLTNTYCSPVVVCTPQYASNTVPAATRVTGTTSNSFEVCLQNPQGDSIGSTPIHYMVVEEGAWMLPNGEPIQANRMRSDKILSGWSRLDYSTNLLENITVVNEAAYSGSDYVATIAQVMSDNGTSWCAPAFAGERVAWQPQLPSDCNVGRHMGQDPNNQFLPETIGTIIMNRAGIDLFNVHCQATLGTVDSGIGEGRSSTLSITGFSEAPAIVLSGIGGLNNDNMGYWPVIDNDDPFSSTGVKMNLDIDRYSSPTRVPSSGETVSLCAFAAPIIYSGRDGVNNAPIFNGSPQFLYYPVGLPVSGSLASCATDPDGDGISFIKNSGPSWLTIASDGTLSGTPDMSNLGNNSFSVTASDGSKSATVQLIVSVTMGDNPIPVTTDMDDDDTATAQTTYDLGPADLAGAWAELNDSEGMSLREALWFANKAEGTDNIVFDLSADTWNDMTITLTNGTRLVIDSPVIIDGGSGIVIDANHESRVMYINDGNGDGDTTVVKLKNLTISGGDGDKSTETASGAGIYNDEILTLENCTVRDNKVIGGNGNWQDGIGIKNTGQLTLLNSRVLNNTSTYKRSRGGGISAGGTVYIINSIVADNAVSAGGRTHGGGIWFTGDELIIVNSSIYGNLCGVAEDGCGIKNVGATLEIYSSIIAGNKQGSVLTNNITGGAEITSSLVGDNIIFDGSTWVDGGNNIIGTNYATEVFDGSVTNSGTDFGAIIYSDGTNYDSNDNDGAYSRVTPYVDAKGYVRVSGAGVDIGAHEIQVSESGESYYNAWATNQNLSGTNAAYDVDVDGDGLNNFLEYIYGGDPQSPVGAVAHRPKLRRAGQGAPYDGLEYTFRFRRGAAQRQLSYTAENSLKLGAGASWSTCTNIQTTPINEDIEEVSVYLPASTHSGFVRIKFLINP